MEICEKRWNEDFGSLKFGKIQFYDFLISFRILDGNQAITASILQVLRGDFICTIAMLI